MTAPKKDTIYIDLEDDITAIIDKVTAASSNIIALVPPKRSGVLQSIVNMKLLKRAADDAKKRLVLITNESSLLPLAAAVQLHVADSLQSRPEIPAAPIMDEDDLSIIEDDTAPTPEPVEVPVAAPEPVLPPETPVEELVDDEPPEATVVTTPKKEKKAPIVPSFNRFRKKMILGGVALVALIALWVVAFMIMPKANITIRAQASRLDTKFKFAVDTEATQDDFVEKRLSGESKEIKRTLSEKFTPTGEKDVGKKATGTMTVANCQDSDGYALPAGTVFTDGSSKLQFTSTQSVTIPGSGISGGECDREGKASVPVRANAGGDEYNLSARSYSVQSSAELFASGSQMTGGTSEIVKVVTAKDIERASKKLFEREHDEIKDELGKQFGESQFVLTDSFQAKHEDVEATPKSGEQAEEGEVSASFTFNMIGVTKEAMKQMLEESQRAQLSGSQQAILDNGLGSASIKLDSRPNNHTTEYSLRTDAFAGPNIDKASLANEISGKRYGEVVELIRAKEGVNEVEVDLSPFWVNKAPKPGKTTINIEVADHTLQ